MQIARAPFQSHRALTLLRRFERTVVGTCVNVGVADTNPLVVMLCQDFVAGVSGAGDSGSPVFQPIAGRPHAARLYGILWGGASGFYVFSALENLREEFGPFETH